jgi:hypothetical protein
MIIIKSEKKKSHKKEKKRKYSRSRSRKHKRRFLSKKLNLILKKDFIIL